MSYLSFKLYLSGTSKNTRTFDGMYLPCFIVMILPLHSHGGNICKHALLSH